MQRFFVLKSEVEKEKITMLFELLEIRPSSKEPDDLHTWAISLGSGEVWKQPIFSCVFISSYNFDQIFEMVDIDKAIYDWFDDNKEIIKESKIKD